MTGFTTTHIGLLGIATGLLSSFPASAQDRVTLGLGLAAVPAYQGADEYRVLPFPLLNVQMGPFFASVVNGIGMNVIDTPEFKFGGSVTYVRGYRSRDIPNGIDSLSDGMGARLFSSVKLGGVNTTFGATRVIGGTKGTIVDLQLSYPMMMSRRLSLIPSVSTTWANDKHMNGYFGITSAEAQASGLRAFRAGGGFKDITAGVTASYHLSGGLNLTASGGMSYLFDRAADSPLVEHRWRPAGFMGLSYSF